MGWGDGDGLGGWRDKTSSLMRAGFVPWPYGWDLIASLINDDTLDVRAGRACYHGESRPNTMKYWNPVAWLFDAWRKRKARAEKRRRAITEYLRLVLPKNGSQPHPLRALQMAGATTVGGNAELIALCDEIVQRGETHPFEDEMLEPIPKEMWYSLLLEAERSGCELNGVREAVDFILFYHNKQPFCGIVYRQLYD